jgi:hypothetical protein
LPAKDDLRYIRRLRERELKKRDRETLRELRDKVRVIRTGRRERIAEIRALCRAGRARARAAVKLLREQTMAELGERVRALREAERGTCQVSQSNARAAVTAALHKAQDELRNWSGYVRSRYGRKRRAPGVPSAAELRREAREESDDAVRRNVGPELAAVFDRVRKNIKAGPRRSRTEAFLEWVESNPDEAHAIVYANSELELERMIRQQQELERRLGNRYADDADLASALGEVPF